MMAPITICKGGVQEVGDDPPKEAVRKPVLKLHLGRHCDDLLCRRSLQIRQI